MRRILVMMSCLVLMYSTAGAATTKQGSSSPEVSHQDMAKLHTCASCHSLTKDEAGKVLGDLGEVIEVRNSDIKGLYEVMVQRDNRQAAVYVDFSKKLLLPGPIFDIATKRPISPAPKVLPKVLSRDELKNIPLEHSLVMGNPAGKKRIFVFTDPDCPFCGRLHGELKKLVSLEPDLAIYIKLFPLKMHPQAYDKSRVILGEKSLALLEKAFAKETLPQPGNNDPKEPVDATIKLGESLGIDGTPALIMPDGSLVSGARSAEELRGLLSPK